MKLFTTKPSRAVRIIQVVVIVFVTFDMLCIIVPIVRDTLRRRDPKPPIPAVASPAPAATVPTRAGGG